MTGNYFFNDFANPGSEFQPANYWFWQRLPTRQEIDQQLGEMLDAGFQTFFIQPRLAFPIDQYLSEEYLDAYRYAIEQAEKLGVKAGIYDDYNWNSGHAGGLTVKDHNEFRERQLFWSSAVVSEPSFSLEISEITTLMGDTLGGPQGNWTYESGKPVWDEWQIIKVLAYPIDHKLQPEDQFTDLGSYCSIKAEGINQCKVQVNLPGEKYLGQRITVFVSARCMTSRHINYLDPRATTRFIEVGYEPYRRSVGELFGKTIFCMFMDHPHAGFYSWKQKEGNIKNSLMFDEGLQTAFQKEHRYPIELAWLAFLLPESDSVNQMRGDFFDTYGRMARENFLAQISDWCHQNGLQFAGHELFGFLGTWGFYGGYHVVDQRTDFGGDYFGIGRYKDLSTVDAYNSNPQIDAKMGDSIARANGKHGCLLEQYYFYPNHDFPGAIGHWNLTYEEMRAQAIRHTLFGTRQFIFHGFYLTDDEGGFELLASSRFDFAPGVNFEPWFSHHRNFADEISRLSSFIYHSDPISDIGVLYPLSTFWVEETDGNFGAESAVWHQKLLEYGLGFDIVEEEGLRFDQSMPGCIQAGPHAYKILILPGVKILMDWQKVQAIVDFVKTGGQLFLTGQMPSRILFGTRESSVTKIFADLANKFDNVHFAQKAENKIHHLINSVKIIMRHQPMIHIKDESAGKIWSWTGKNASSYLVALFNEESETNRIRIEIPGKDMHIERWNVLDGEKSDWRWYYQDDRSTHIMVDLEPGSITCFSAATDKKVKSANHLEKSSMRVIDAGLVDGKPIVKVVADHGGEYEITFNTAGGGISNETISVSTMPDPFALEKGWSISLPFHGVTQPIDISRGWETQGFADYAGEGTYTTTFDFPTTTPDWKKWNWKIVFPKIVSSAEILFNEKSLGFRSWSPYEVMLPTDLMQNKSNHLLVKVFNTAGNRYYAGSPYAVENFPSGIIGAPIVTPIKLITIQH